MATCPTCRRQYPDEATRCADDGEALLPDAAFKSADVDLAAGTMVGEYRIERKLGAGGFGTVYRASHPVIGKPAAVKVLSRQYSSNPQMVSRFIAEARAANKIGHKNIVDVFSFGTLEDGRQYYTMELLEGATLDAYLRDRGKLAPEEMIPLFRSIARALDAAHVAGIAHRDLKPENVFLVNDEDAGLVPKLLDFGIAKLLTEGTSGPKTRTGTPMGTPEYMSPEQCRGKDVDHRTDIYAFGVMAFEALVGRRPFKGEMMDLLVHHVHTEPPTPSAECPGLSPELDGPILKMLAKDRDARPASVGLALLALESAAIRAGHAVRPAPGPHVGGPSLAPLRGDADTLTPTQAAALAALTPGEVGTPPTRSLAGASTDAKPARPRRRGALAIGAAALAAAAVAAAAFSLGGASDPAPVASSEAPATAEPPAPTAPAIAEPVVSAERPPAAPPSAAAEVDLVIQSTPEQAEVYLGGKRLGTAPGPIKVARGDAKVKLTVKAPGYRSAEVAVVPSANGIVSIALVKAAAKTPRSELEF